MLVAAGCGQKAGVAGSLAAAGTAQTGVAGEEFTGGVNAETGGGAATGGGATAAGGGGGGKTATGGRAAPGAPTGSSTGTTPTGGGGGGAAAPGTAGPLDRTGITPTTIKIGVHGPKTGAAPASTVDQAIGVYAQWAGNIKGLGNRHLEVVFRDDHFDPATARTVCKELVEKEHVFILIGIAGVDAIKSCAEYAASQGVPYFSPGVTEGPFRNLANYFALSETYSQQNVQLAQLIAHQIKKKKVGMVLTDSPLLDETEARFKAEAAKNGLTVVYTGRLAHDAGKAQTDTQISNLKSHGAEVVYALISPLVFGFLVSSAKQQSYYPPFTGPGLSNGVNLVATGICPPPPFPNVRFLSPMVQLDVIDKHDANYKPAYRKKNSGQEPDDIGILEWGIEKSARLFMEADGPNPSRQTLVRRIATGKPFATNVYAPVKYGGLPHFGAASTTLLTLDCNNLRYRTTATFVSKF
jgi:ABC-type branched-subunit amino acid transport system substrate-binding protein